MPCQWREDAGMRYLHLDYRRVPAEEYLNLLAWSVRMIEAEPPGALMLVEAPGVPAASEFLSAVKRASHDVFGPLRTRKVYLTDDKICRSIIRGLTSVAPSIHGHAYSTQATALAALRLQRTLAATVTTVDPVSYDV